MIDLGSIAGLHQHNHELHAYCGRCDRWRVLDLEAMVRQGRGNVRLPIRVRCRDCGAVGQLQVRPPMPARGSVGWISAIAPNSCTALVPRAGLEPARPCGQRILSFTKRT